MRKFDKAETDVSGRPVVASPQKDTKKPKKAKKASASASSSRTGTLRRERERDSDSDTAMSTVELEVDQEDRRHNAAIARATSSAFKDMDENDHLLAAQHQPRSLDSCSTFGYCFGYFAKTACRVIAGAGAATGAAYGLGLPVTQLPVAAIIGAVGAVVARCGDDIFEASRTVEARVQGEVGIGRQIASVIVPLPEPKRTYPTA